eukprot:s4382_g7.t1
MSSETLACFIATPRRNINDLMCIHDASSAAKGRRYAQEGILIGLADDHFWNKHKESEVTYDDESAPTWAQLMRIQENGNPELPMDFYGDCRDLFELVTGLRTLPQDKGQRLYVLGIKEARVTGRIRQVVLVRCLRNA